MDHATMIADLNAGLHDALTFVHRLLQADPKLRRACKTTGQHATTIGVAGSLIIATIDGRLNIPLWMLVRDHGHEKAVRRALTLLDKTGWTTRILAAHRAFGCWPPVVTDHDPSDFGRVIWPTQPPFTAMNGATA